MAKYSHATFGNISGTVNNAVGTSWRGVNYLRNIAKKSGKAPSDAQLAVQAKLALAAFQLSRIKTVLNMGFSDTKLNKLTGYNAAVREFIQNAITGNFPDLAIDYSKMQISRGSLTVLKGLALAIVGNVVTLTWAVREDAILGNADDGILVLLYNSTKDEYMTDCSGKRNVGEIVVTIPEEAGDQIEVWLFCISKDKKAVSTSQYAGSATVTV
jgi:hypothetical protein